MNKRQKIVFGSILITLFFIQYLIGGWGAIIGVIVGIPIAFFIIHLIEKL